MRLLNKPPWGQRIKKARNTIEFTKELIIKYERGVRVTELTRMYWKSALTISSILAKKKEIKEADVVKEVNVLTKQRSQTIEDVENILLVWINEQQLAGDSVSEAINCKKARLLHANFAPKKIGTGKIGGSIVPKIKRHSCASPPKPSTDSTSSLITKTFFSTASSQENF